MNPAEAPVLIVAGGTGGHIFPGLAVAQSLRALNVPVVWLGAERGLETRLVPAHGISLETVPVSALRGKSRLQKLRAPWMLLRALTASLALLRRLRPRSVLSLGGYVAGPGGVAAWLTRRPLLVHEQNRVAGFTNRVLAHLARRVLCGFADALPGAQWTGNPVRAAIADLSAPATRFGERDGPVRVLVLGGSQGAQALNLGVPRAIARMDPEARPQIVHQCGARGLDSTREAYAAAGVSARIEAFIDDVAGAYAWADLAICRAGALTLAELAAAGLGAVLIPFPQAVDDHQTRNAEALVAAGAAELLQQNELNPQCLASLLQPLLADRTRLLAMAQAARGLARVDAADRIARECLEVAT